MPSTSAVDVHQHLWPPALLDALRSRPSAPMLRGWTLHTAGEPPFVVDPDHHDPDHRRRREAPGTEVLLSLSTPLGIEALPPAEAGPVLAAWHTGVADLPAGFGGWAGVGEVDPDLAELERLLAAGFVGVQLAATAWSTPAALEATAEILRVAERADRPVLVHPGPVTTGRVDAPAWWAAVVDYPAQLQAAWWSWHVAGRAMFPALRVCFAAGAGLAPVHHERFAVRSGQRFVVDRDVFVDISSYGRQGVDALSRALGIDVLVLGSDRPYAEPPDHQLGDAAHHALSVANPARLLRGDR